MNLNEFMLDWINDRKLGPQMNLGRLSASARAYSWMNSGNLDHAPSVRKLLGLITATVAKGTGQDGNALSELVADLLDQETRKLEVRRLIDELKQLDCPPEIISKAEEFLTLV